MTEQREISILPKGGHEQGKEGFTTGVRAEGQRVTTKTV